MGITDPICCFYSNSIFTISNKRKYKSHFYISTRDIFNFSAIFMYIIYIIYLSKSSIFITISNITISSINSTKQSSVRKYKLCQIIELKFALNLIITR